MEITRRNFVVGLSATVLAMERMTAGEEAREWESGFVSGARLATLRRRLNQAIEPTSTAWWRVQWDADAAAYRRPIVPARWYVPNRYIDPDGQIRAQAPLVRDANAAYALALAFQMTSNPRYCSALRRIVDAWSSGIQTFSIQDDSKLAFCYHFPAIIFAAGMVGTHPCLPESSHGQLAKFIRDKALFMSTINEAQNHGNWGMVFTMAAATYLQDTKLFDLTIERWKQFIETQVAPDGHLSMEVSRNNGVGERGICYSSFCLAPQIVAAEIARINGVNLYEYRSPSGHTMRAVYERLVPWIANPSTFPYYKGPPGGQKETDRNISYLEILNPRWNNTLASALIRSHRPMNDLYAGLAYLTFTHGDLLRDAG